MAAILPVGVEHTHHSSHVSSHEEEHDYGDTEPIIVKKVAVHERLAQEMKKCGVGCEALAYGSHPLEHKEAYYSHGFALSSRLVTNKGLVKIEDKNINFVQVLQRN